MEMEGYSKNGCGRKDKCSLCSGGRVGGKKVEVRREGPRGRAEASQEEEGRGRKGQNSPTGLCSRLPALLPTTHPPSHPRVCLTAAHRQTDLPGLLSAILKLGHLKQSFLSTNTLISGIWGRKKRPWSLACQSTEIKINIFIETIFPLNSYLWN